GADRLLHKPVRAGLLIVLRREDPPGAAYVGGADQDREIEERLVKMKDDGFVADQLYALRLLAQYVLPGATVMVIAPFHVLRRERAAVVEFEARAQHHIAALAV